MEYYNWPLTHSFTKVKLYIIIGERSIGKTYGLRLEVIKDYIKNGWRFCEIVRNADDLSAFSSSYFEKISNNNEFPEHIFKVEKNKAYIAKKPDKTPKIDKNGEYVYLDSGEIELIDEPVKWQLCGYFVALTREQKLKTLTFDKVRNVNFDEAIIDKKRNEYARYLKNEYASLLGVINTVLRENPKNPKPARIHLLGNACDLTCPYFRAFGINKLPPKGRSFYKNRFIMIDRTEGKYAEEFRNNTTLGILMSGNDDESGVFFSNDFETISPEKLAKKPNKARFLYGLKFDKHTFGVWFSNETGYLYINSKAPSEKNSGRPTYVFTYDDLSINYQLLDRSSDLIKLLKNCAAADMIRFENELIYGEFSDFLYFIGLK